MDAGKVHYQRDGVVARVTFDRPQAHNAMTWAMYEELGEACEKIGADPAVRVVVFRGVGGKAFVSGTDIGQFREFSTADDGVRYERELERYLAVVETLPVPTLAVVEGWAVGGGLALATVCDLRMATPESRFGVPIARTLGNCLSVENVTRLVAAFGASRAKKILVLGEMLSCDEALACGFLSEAVIPERLDTRVAELCARLAANAPLTMRVSKEAIRRVVQATASDGEDLVRICYGSEDFRIGRTSFSAKRTPQWTGR